MFFIAAITLGLLGSFHCIGMCGPIALALPMVNHSPIHKFASVLLYNFGRALTYTALGVFFGLIGTGFAIFGLQQILSITIGALILITVLFPSKLISRFSFTNKLSQAFYGIKNKLSYLFTKKSMSSLFFIGILNGLLPCGLVYMAVVGAIATGNPLNGGLFMAVFGLGTIPAMLTVSMFSHMINAKFRSGINKAVPYVVSVMAIFMILRGLNLNIPYISPGFEEQTQTVSCCEKPNDSAENESCESECCKKK